MNNPNPLIDLELSQVEWSILDMLSVDSEPLEIIDGLVAQLLPKSGADDTLLLIYNLFRMGFLTIRQIPIQALGQSFPKREVLAYQPLDVVGDLRATYQKYRQTRRYLSTYLSNGVINGIPFGIWLILTRDGQQEADRQLYQQYWNQWSYPS